MNPWILLGLLFMVAGAMSGWWLNRHPAISAEPIGMWSFPDDFDEHVAIAGVLDGDSRFMARWCDQPTIDQLFAGMVAVHRAQVHNHTDKET